MKFTIAEEKFHLIPREVYIKGYSANVRDTLDGMIAKLVKYDLLYQFVDKFVKIDLHPDVESNHEMAQSGLKCAED